MPNFQIIFNQGESHTVLITIKPEFPITNYTPEISVAKNRDEAPVKVYEFGPQLQKNGQDILLTILPADTEEISGDFNWQLSLTHDTDPTAQKQVLDPYLFTVKQSNKKPEV